VLKLTVFFALAEGLNMSRLGPVGTGGMMIPLENLFFARITLVGWKDGS
jgi:hypothetical protein